MRFPTGNSDFEFPQAFGFRQSFSMTRIFSTLAMCSNLLLIATFWLGLGIGDARVRESVVQSRVMVHFLAGVAPLVFAVLVHALVITYFMGTGRWMNETSR